ncbi:Transcriptional regulator containing PAS, AAA-type ATPase, and DNA-binding Fis domains [Tissierella praeacuta DSM 18095]|uniref:Transcriptional regulator containing PAS, AAA-type ATPase, and DNA-binding Fis domains n=2 Tax=Tissierella praeacuta TaxID=43131 RepID=A0A1M4UG44_9FIRM|nr:transcriptional regulator with PAS, ATPase and Fis domain [Tissierella praeacuta]SHE55686.1 Transcriptional regulator containing PAS, AAA-type ATPase, and DNA-binding Fis domains [Tissierella praeacuta DSM 18095]SUP03880.1 Nif-specific regulatory protein [Tissierella praeacuta]
MRKNKASVGVVKMSLFRIQDSVQEVAEAIEAVLNVDVTIIDENMYRVAATGQYRDSIGSRIPNSCSFEVVAETKKPQVINKPNISKQCFSCSLKGSCSEMATLGYPILNNDKLVGVIGLIAFKNDQKKKIQEQKEDLLIFLSRLSDLIVGNINYYETINSITIQHEETRMIIDSLDKGIICTDENGNIKFVNSNIENYLVKDKYKLIDTNIDKIFPYLKEKGEESFSIEKKIKIGNKKNSFIIRNIPVIVEGKTVSNILEIQRTFDMVRNAYKLMEGERKVTFKDILGNSPKMLEVKSIAKNIAPSESTVLLRGESGTGKELFARAIHYESDRNKAPFIAINCASIPDNLLESELFGYEEGAFTGAKKEGKMGKFELANGGTLFLDEIGDLPIHLQPKLLRVLQEQSFMRVGGKELINISFRLIAATNRNLEEMVYNGEFREDLYYRLNVIPIIIPPLRERQEDIELLSENLLNKNCLKLEKEKKFYSKEIKEAFHKYHWPGNIRELENTVEYLVNMAKEEEISYDALPMNVKDYLCNEKCIGCSHEKTLKDMVDKYEKDILERYLKEYGSSTKDKELIAEILDINLSTLYRKLTKYNLQ